MVARGFYEEIDHPVAGRHPVPGLPFRLSGVQHWLRQPAPTIGQHNREILSELLGMTEAEIDALEAAEVIGTLPKGL
jgi:crotonobetainyl-CoA:carnitine CoA-transferase CaiB-like acyl-CoA transferase